MGDAEVANKFKQIAASMNQLSPAATKAASSTKQVDTALKSTGTAATTASTNVKSYSGALTGFSSGSNQAKTSTDAFGGALQGLNTQATTARGGLDQTNTVVKSSITPMAGLGNEGQKTGGKLKGLTEVFRGNKGLIFSVTMLGSGISEAISMFQGYQDASDKLSAAKEKLADLEARGMENTKEYGQAAKEAADAQRGFNFIQRFTIQSFADLIPMSLMLTSSLIEMGATMNKGAGIKAKLASAGTKLVGVIGALGTAMMAFTVRHPLLLLLTAVVGVALALITNFGGLRDAINSVGVEIGKWLPMWKPILEVFGIHMNQLADTAAGYLDFGKQATAATTDVEKQVVKSGNATTMSYNGQIALMNKLGEESETIAFSMGAHLKMQQQDQEAHAEKYDQFVNAMQSGDAKIMQSLGLTADEYKTFYEEWTAELEAFDEKFGTVVESIVEGWTTLNERGAEASTTLVEKINDIEAEITELTNQQWDMDKDEDIEKNQQKIGELQAKLADLKGNISDATLSGAQDFHTLQEAGKTAIDGIGMAIIGQDFTGAIEILKTAIDTVPPKYQENFSKIETTISSLKGNNRAAVAQIISDYGSLEQAFKPLIVGAYELSLADAELAAGFDELSVAARANSTNMGEAGAAWFTFLKSLSPAQKNLPIIQDLITRVDEGLITHAEALAEAEAAGVSWSGVLGKDVTTSIKNVQKSFIDLGNGTSAMVAEVNGQMVNLGTVSNTELGNMSDDLKTTDTSMASTAQTANKELEKGAAGSFGVLGKDGKFHFGTVVTNANNTMLTFQAVNKSADTYLAKGVSNKYKAMGDSAVAAAKTTGDEAGKMETELETFKTNAVKWLGEVQTALDNLWKSAQERLKNTNFQNLLPSIPEAGAEEDKQGGGYEDMFGKGQAILDKAKGGVPGGMTAEQVKALHTAWSSFSTSMSAYSTSITAAVTKIQTAFSTLSTSVATYMTSMKTNTAGFFLALNTQIGAIIPIITMLQQTFSTLSTSVATYSVSMKTNTAALFLAINTQIGAIIPIIQMLQQTFSTLSTSVMTYMKSMQTNIAAWGMAAITTMGEVMKIVLLAQGTFSTFSTSIATYMNSMLTNTANWGKVTLVTFGEVMKQVLLAQKTYSTFSTSVSTYMKSMGTNTKTWQTTSTTALNTVASTITKTQGVASKFSTSWATYMKSMTANLKKFVSEAVSGLNKVTSAANKATSALNKMAAAAKKAASAASKVGGGAGMHGFTGIRGGQHGFEGIVTKPTILGSGPSRIKMGEDFKPELVNVQPLTKGSGNSYGNLKRAAGGGGGGGKPIVINNIITLDGREITRFIHKVGMDGMSLQT